MNEHNNEEQHKLLVADIKDHEQRIGAVEHKSDQNENMIRAVNSSTAEIQKWVGDAHRVLYGDDKIGLEGLVKQHNKMWNWVSRAIIGIAICVFLFEKLGFNLVDLT